MVEPHGFINLFQGNPNAYGLVHGESIKQPVTHAVWDNHLHGDTPIGIYPLFELTPADRGVWAAEHGGLDGGRFYVRWGCTDLDNKDDPDSLWPLALNMHKALKALGITAWIERTKGKGFHVWVFAVEPIPAIVMRRALLAAHQVAGVAPTEVNPKQVDVSTLKVGLGNYVNAPYPHDAVDRRVVLWGPWGVEPTAPMPLGVFLADATAMRSSFDVLKRAALLYREPPKRVVGSYTEPTVEASALSEKLSGLGYTIWKNGVLEGRDRSGTLQRLAHLMAEGGLAPGEAKVLLRDADGRWGKFADRADCEEQLDRMIGAAFSKER